MFAAWSHPGRCRDDGAFAMLAGAAPIPASSGKTVRYRLNRSGDRQLNRALHTIVVSRLRYDPDTRAYAQRRRAEGKTDPEIRRCLKRYISRQLYRQLERPSSRRVDEPEERHGDGVSSHGGGSSGGGGGWGGGKAGTAGGFGGGSGGVEGQASPSPSPATSPTPPFRWATPPTGTVRSC
ncbi:IS110 family transposase [Pseudonocardia sp. WMMC193]|nr:IS110 family transposase [Pseudonocardia sp. WMMC193]